MTRYRSVLAIALALSLVLAGCASIGTQTSPTGADPNGDTPATETLRSQAMDAMGSVERYSVAVEESRTIVVNTEQTIGIEQTVEVDRTNRRLHAAVSRSIQGRTIESDLYLLNETLYQRSQAFVRQFSTEWIKIDLAGNFSRAWQVQDSLARQRQVLNASTVRLNGTERINGTEAYEAYRLEANASAEELERVFAEMMGGAGSAFNESTYSISEARFTFWLSTETARPLKVTGEIDSRVSIQGRTTDLYQSFEFRYDYDNSVSVDLPDEADGAISLREAINGSSGG